MLIDTGATKTCMALDVATDLGLTPVGFGQTYGAGGLHSNPFFEALLTLSIKDSFGQMSSVRHQGRVMGIPELGRQLDQVGLDVGGDPTRLIGLLGRDILRYASFEYHGSRGIIELAFDFDAMPERPQ